MATIEIQMRQDIFSADIAAVENDIAKNVPYGKYQIQAA